MTFQRRGEDDAAAGAGGAHSRLRGHHGEQEPQGVLPASSLMHSQRVQRNCKEEQTQVFFSLFTQRKYKKNCFILKMENLFELITYFVNEIRFIKMFSVLIC